MPVLAARVLPPFPVRVYTVQTPALSSGPGRMALFHPILALCYLVPFLWYNYYSYGRNYLFLVEETLAHASAPVFPFRGFREGQTARDPVPCHGDSLGQGRVPVLVNMREVSSMYTITADAVRRAADVFGIADQASLNEIRSRFRILIKEWHPDVTQEQKGKSEERTREILNSYDTLVEYCTNHPISFRMEDIYQPGTDLPSDYWMKRFGDDPIWS